MRASSRKRETLAQNRFLAAIALAMAMLLTLALPSAQEFEKQTAALPINAYSEAYLAVLVKANPRDGGTRLAWVKQLAARGDFAAALRELALVPHDARWGEVAEQLGFDIAWTAARARPEGSRARREAFEEVVRRMDELLRRGSPAGAARTARYTELAHVALELERPELAARLFEGIAAASSGPAQTAALAEAGRWYLARGDFAQALRVYEAAVRAATNDAEVAAFIEKTLATRLAAGQSREAATAAAAWVELRPQDRALFRRAIELATAADDPQTARDLGRRLLVLAPEDVPEAERQVGRELAAGDPAAAWPLVQAATARHPESTAWRVREATIAEWTGHPRVALKDWLYLATQGGVSKAAGTPARDEKTVAPGGPTVPGSPLAPAGTPLPTGPTLPAGPTFAPSALSPSALSPRGLEPAPLEGIKP